MTDLGYVRKILGRGKSKGTKFLSQEKNLGKVLEVFEINNAKLVQLPLASHFRLRNLQCPPTKAEKQD